jgi:hypothetical protein
MRGEMHVGWPWQAAAVCAAMAACMVAAMSCAALPGAAVQPGGGGALPGTADPPSQQTALPAIPRDEPADPAAIAVRHASLETTRVLDGDTFADKSASAVANPVAHTLTLSSAAQTYSWGMYSFDSVLSTDSPFVLTVELNTPLPALYYVGVADYARGSWHWQAVNAPTGEDSLSLPLALNPVSAGSRLYAAVIAYGGEQVVVRRATLRLQATAPPPMGLSASDGASGSTIALSWTDPAASYPGLAYDAVVIERAAAPGGPWAALTEVSAGTTAYNDVHDGAGNVIPYNVPVYYRLRTKVGVTTGSPGLADSGLRVLAKVTGLSATDGTYPDKIVLTWDAVSGAATYDIEYMRTDIPMSWTALASTASASFQHTTSAPPGDEAHDSVVYDYRVRAVYLGDTSLDWSGVASGFCNAPPTAALAANPTSGNPPLSVDLDASASSDPGGAIALYEWDWNGDGTYDASGVSAQVTHSFGRVGVLHPAVRVTDAMGARDGTSVALTIHGWVHTWGLNDDEQGEGIAVDSLGNAYMAGWTPQNHGDVLLLKYDPTGSLLWRRRYGGADMERANAVAIGPYGDAYLAGSQGLWGGNEDVLLLKFSPDGVRSWQKTWDSGNDDAAYGLTVDSSGNVFVAGAVTSAVTGAGVLLLKYNNSGTVVWRKTWGGAQGDTAYAVALDGTDVCLAGETASYGAGHADGLLLRYNSTGALEKATTWGTALNDESARAMTIAPEGNVYLAGYSREDIMLHSHAALVKLDSSGALLWARSWGGATMSTPLSGLVLSGGKLFAAGSLFTTTVDSAALLLYYDTAGTAQWQKAWYQDAGIAWLTGIARDASGRLRICGNALRAQGEWQLPTGTELPFTPVVSDVTGTAGNLSGTAADLLLGASDVNGWADAGGGARDYFVGQYDPALD